MPHEGLEFTTFQGWRRPQRWTQALDHQGDVASVDRIRLGLAPEASGEIFDATRIEVAVSVACPVQRQGVVAGGFDASMQPPWGCAS